jgi:CDP-diacylglycerol--serine O-phosphatidyltransferase
MSDESRPIHGRVLADVQRRVGLTTELDEPHFLSRLDTADRISLVALFFAWGAAVLLLAGEPNWGILAMFGAFGFDKLDGYWARSFDQATAVGRQIDSYIDVFTYLVAGALLFHVAISPHLAASVVVGFLLVAFGGLRLVRFNEEGFRSDDGGNYYRGMTVVHANAVVVANYFLLTFRPLGVWNGWLAALAVAAVCPLLLSNWRSYKTTAGHALVAVGGVLAIGLALFLELA